MSRSVTSWAALIFIALPSLVASQRHEPGDQMQPRSGIVSVAEILVKQRDPRRCEGAASCVRWCLERDGDHPAWPPKLRLVPADESCPHPASRAFRINSSQAAGVERRPSLVRVNDVLTLSEDTFSLRVSLEGVALSDGTEGDEIRVRLPISGKVMRACVIAKKRARLIQDAREVR
ncbi:MAG: flagella basal body P-ring formation protein FlgA [Acidobacteria bacterium]|nr:flagella basal body P-ring formation protein FlgA [Acidobacteriota bacterium]